MNTVYFVCMLWPVIFNPSHTQNGCFVDINMLRYSTLHTIVGTPIQVELHQMISTLTCNYFITDRKISPQTSDCIGNNIVYSVMHICDSTVLKKNHSKDKQSSL